MQGIHYLLGAHCIGLLTISLAIGIGTHFYAGKLTTLTSKAITSGIPTPALFKLLNAPARDINSNSITTLAKHLPVDERLHIYGQPGIEFSDSFVVLCTDSGPTQFQSEEFTSKRFFTREPFDLAVEDLPKADPKVDLEVERKVELTAPDELVAKFMSPTVIPRDLAAVEVLAEGVAKATEGDAVSNSKSDVVALQVVVPQLAPEQLTAADGLTAVSTSVDIGASFQILKAPNSAKFGQTCAIWTSGQAHGSIVERFAVLLRRVKCVITPNFPLNRLSQNLLCTLFGNVIVMMLAWSHSIALPQPVSMVHAPRLIIYALLDAWRILILYALKVAVESIPLVQRYLQDWERYLDTGSGAVNEVFGRGGGEGGGGEVISSASPFFSSSSFPGGNYPARVGWYISWVWRVHILPRLNGYGGFENFDASDHIVLYAMLVLIVITEIVCMVTYRRQEKKAIDSPFTMRARGLISMSLLNLGVILLILYNTLMTSLYFHTPLEAWIGLSIAAFGIYLPFWLALLFLESLNFYF